MEMMQERKARDNNKKVLKAQPHKPEFCRMQNSGLTLLAVVSFCFHQHLPLRIAVSLLNGKTRLIQLLIALWTGLETAMEPHILGWRNAQLTFNNQIDPRGIIDFIFTR